MAEVTKEIIQFFKKHDLLPQNIDQENIIAKSSNFPAYSIREIIPDNFTSMDAECIDEANSYHSVLLDFARITNKEWNPTDITFSDSGELQNITIGFNQNGESHTFTFDQEGMDYIADGFITELMNFAESNLHGTFLALPTEDQGLHFAYLPVSIAAELKELINRDDIKETWIAYIMGE